MSGLAVPSHRPPKGIRVVVGALAATCLTLVLAVPAQAADPVDMGAAHDFSVLAVTLTSNGPTAMSDDLGVSPGATFAGDTAPIVLGTKHLGDTAAANAAQSLQTAYGSATTQLSDAPLPANLGGVTLTPGVYNAPAAMGFTAGTVLTLDGENDPDAVFILQIGAALTVGASSRVDLVRGAKACNVFWAVGAAASIGATANFAGTVMAVGGGAVDVGAGSRIDGRLLGDGAVTLSSNAIRTACSETVVVPGPAGPAGPQGATGASGSDGADGATGSAGADGADGATGSAGADGNDGADGATGPAGADGNNGAAGNDGTNGTDGLAGTDGNDGAQGIIGPTGLIGLTGVDGLDGVAGNDGADGTDGANGIDGNDGAAGTTGATGADGNDGADGAAGTDGNDGADGAAGTDGTDGDDGTDGTDGDDGTNGVDGAQGIIGPRGFIGLTGVDGLDGLAGNDGADGAQGIAGATGATGLAGRTGSPGPAGPAGPAGPTPSAGSISTTALCVTNAATKRQVRAGRTVGWTFVVKNCGGVAASGVSVTKRLGANATVTSRGGGTLTGRKLTWKMESLAPGASATMHVATRLRANPGANRFVSWTWVTADAANSAPATASASTKVLSGRAR